MLLLKYFFKSLFSTRVLAERDSEWMGNSKNQTLFDFWLGACRALLFVQRMQTLA